MELTLLDVRFAAAVHHDHPLLRGQLVPGALYLRDLGFYDHREFAAIDEGNAFFASRLKYNAKPTIQRVFSGLPTQGLEGEELHHGLPYEPVVDVDAHFRIENEPKGRVFRVVKVDVPARDRHGRPTGKILECWYVTNLPRDTFSAEMINGVPERISPGWIISIRDDQPCYGSSSQYRCCYRRWPIRSAQNCVPVVCAVPSRARSSWPP